MSKLKLTVTIDGSNIEGFDKAIKTWSDEDIIKYVKGYITYGCFEFKDTDPRYEALNDENISVIVEKMLITLFGKGII